MKTWQWLWNWNLQKRLRKGNTVFFCCNDASSLNPLRLRNRQLRRKLPVALNDKNRSIAWSGAPIISRRLPFKHCIFSYTFRSPLVRPRIFPGKSSGLPKWVFRLYGFADGQPTVSLAKELRHHGHRERDDKSIEENEELGGVLLSRPTRELPSGSWSGDSTQQIWSPEDYQQISYNLQLIQSWALGTDVQKYLQKPNLLTAEWADTGNTSKDVMNTNINMYCILIPPLM